MHIDESHLPALKKWIVKKLENISDADSDVLADYILALLQTDDSDDEVRKNCEENLNDFLREGSAKFVQDIFDTIHSKSFLPVQQRPPPPPPPLNPLSANFTPFNPPTGPSRSPAGQYPAPNARGHFGDVQNAPLGPSQPQSRKRRYEDPDQSGRNGLHAQGGYGDRPQKQPRGYNDKRSIREQYNAQGPQFGQIPQTVDPSAGFNLPSMDPNNPLHNPMIAMQLLNSMFGISLPPVPGPENGYGNSGRGRRCIDYDVKGFCARGNACQYEHGNDSIVVPSGPNGSPLYPGLPAPVSTRSVDMRRGGPRGFDSNRQPKRFREARAPFSAIGPNHDLSITTIVVENIPEENFSEDQVREHFAEFGNIVEIDMQPYKRLALVKYDDWHASHRAIESPKSIFNNRFVKTYWYKPDLHTDIRRDGARQGNSVSYPQNIVKQEVEEVEPEVDLVEIERKATEAQQAHEERLKKQLQAKSQREELERQIEEKNQLKRTALAQLIAKEKERNGGVSKTEEELKESEEREALEAKLAFLEGEAPKYNVDPDDPYGERYGGYSSFRGRGRGGYYRARGSTYRGRGSFRGGYVPRGGFNGGAVMRLDNRPKKVAVFGVAPGSAEDEGLRSYLFSKYDSNVVQVTPHPENEESQIVSFQERFLAEQFIDDNSTEIVRLKKTWYRDATTSTNGSITNTPRNEPLRSGSMSNDINASMKANGTTLKSEMEDVEQGDLDVEEDEDRWMQ